MAGGFNIRAQAVPKHDLDQKTLKTHGLHKVGGGRRAFASCLKIVYFLIHTFHFLLCVNK